MRLSDSTNWGSTINLYYYPVVLCYIGIQLGKRVVGRFMLFSLSLHLGDLINWHDIDKTSISGSLRFIDHSFPL